MDSLPTKSTATASDRKNRMHVVMFPWLAFGHMIPYLELSKFIAQQGHKVSFISTHRNIQRLPKLPPNLSTLINLVPLTLPPVDGLPEHAEATMDVRSSDIHYLKKAYDGLKPELTRFLEGSNPDWIIHDFAPYWLPPIATKLRISHGFFSIINAWLPGFLGPASAMLDGSDPRTDPEHFTVPPKWVTFPTKVAYRVCEIKRLFAPEANNASAVSDPVRSGLIISGSDAIFIRHCREFEPEWLTVLEQINHKPVIPVGLMPPSAQDSREGENDTWVSISEQLEQQNTGSVVYVALGSEVTLSQDELTELALGLELSGLPFFWALRKPPGSDESNSMELPNGFEERTKGRGVVWTSWVSQLRILAHDSVGGFLTHCGWSSIIEGLQHGLPLIMFPVSIDQGLNARVFEDKEVGIEIPRDENDGSFSRSSVADSLRLVMDEDRGRIYRDKAKEMKTIFGDKERQDQYLHSFVEYLKSNRRLYGE